jgi:hypothetical protein
MLVGTQTCLRRTMSMAAGEYLLVKSQTDAKQTHVAIKRKNLPELETPVSPRAEARSLAFSPALRDRAACKISGSGGTLSGNIPPTRTR